MASGIRPLQYCSRLVHHTGRTGYKNWKLVPHIQGPWTLSSAVRHIPNLSKYSTMADMSEEEWPRVTPAEMRGFMVRCMEAVGTKSDHAQVLAELLLTADYRGHYSHGLNRLDMYVKDIAENVCISNREPEILKQTSGTAWVDGHNLLGPVVGKFCIDLAIEKAKSAGIGWVAAKGYGIHKYKPLSGPNKSKRGANTRLILTMFPMLPCCWQCARIEKAVGTNALAVAAPGKGDDTFELDMATSTVSVGKVELHARKNLPIPNGWGCDTHGVESHDAALVSTVGGLFPLGGSEQSGGYKGTGLILMVEILCSILSGATYGNNVRSWKSRGKIADLGQCFVAIDPSAFAPGFEDRLSDLTVNIRNLPKAAGETEILVAGDPEKKHMKKCDDLGGIPYHPNQIKYARDLAAELKILPPVLC